MTGKEKVLSFVKTKSTYVIKNIAQIHLVCKALKPIPNNYYGYINPDYIVVKAYNYSKNLVFTTTLNFELQEMLIREEFIKNSLTTFIVRPEDWANIE